MRSVCPPAVWERAWETLLAEIEACDPDVLLLLGESGRASLSLERGAVNLRLCEPPYNEGEVRRDEPILSEGPAACFATLPLGRVRDALGEAGIPAEYSLSAGGLLGNEVFHRAMHHPARCDLSSVGFLHVPRTEGEDRPPVSYPRNPIEIVIEALM